MPLIPDEINPTDLRDFVDDNPWFLNETREYRQAKGVSLSAIINQQNSLEFLEYYAATHPDDDGSFFANFVSYQAINFLGLLGSANLHMNITKKKASYHLVKWLERIVYKPEFYSKTDQKVPFRAYENFQLSAQAIDALKDVVAYPNFSLYNQKNFRFIKEESIVFPLDGTTMYEGSPWVIPDYLPRNDPRFSSDILIEEADKFNKAARNARAQEKLANLVAGYKTMGPLDNPFLTDATFTALLETHAKRFAEVTFYADYRFSEARTLLLAEHLRGLNANDIINFPKYIIRSALDNTDVPIDARKQVLNSHISYDKRYVLPDEPYLGFYTVLDGTSTMERSYRVRLLNEDWMIDEVLDALSQRVDEYDEGGRLRRAPNSILLKGLVQNPRMKHHHYWKLFDMLPLQEGRKNYRSMFYRSLMEAPEIFASMLAPAASQTHPLPGFYNDQYFTEPEIVNAFSLRLEYLKVYPGYDKDGKAAFKRKVKKYGMTTKDYGFFEQELPLDLYMEVIETHTYSETYPAKN